MDAPTWTHSTSASSAYNVCAGLFYSHSTYIQDTSLTFTTPAKIWRHGPRAQESHQTNVVRPTEICQFGRSARSQSLQLTHQREGESIPPVARPAHQEFLRSSFAQPMARRSNGTTADQPSTMQLTSVMHGEVYCQKTGQLVIHQAWAQELHVPGYRPSHPHRLLWV